MWCKSGESVGPVTLLLAAIAAFIYDFPVSLSGQPKLALRAPDNFSLSEFSLGMQDSG